MNDLTEPRPPLPKWIPYSSDLRCTHSHSSDEHEDVHVISREQAFEIFLESAELTLASADADHESTRLLERGYFCEVNAVLRVTTSES